MPMRRLADLRDPSVAMRSESALDEHSTDPTSTTPVHNILTSSLHTQIRSKTAKASPVSHHEIPKSKTANISEHMKKRPYPQARRVTLKFVSVTMAHSVVATSTKTVSSINSL